MKITKLSILVMVIVHQVAGADGRSVSGIANYGSSSADYGSKEFSSVAFGDETSVNYGEGSSFSAREIGDNIVLKGFGQNEPPQPIGLDYQISDKEGNFHYHKQEVDAGGTVTGFYGYSNIQGLYRIVDYTADASGYRASIRTNEPGIEDKENPADVQIIVEKPYIHTGDPYTSPDGKPIGGAGIGNAKAKTFESGIPKDDTDDEDEEED